jgi:hypothetical protein
MSSICMRKLVTEELMSACVKVLVAYPFSWSTSPSVCRLLGLKVRT